MWPSISRKEHVALQNLIKSKLSESFSSIIPIALIVALLAVTLTPMEPGIFLLFIFGVVFLIFGLSLFTMGAEMSMQTIGSKIGSYLAKSNKIWLIALVSFLIGVFVTISEPDLQILAKQVADLSGNADMMLILTLVISVGVGIFLIIGMLRVMFKISLSLLLIIFYAITFGLCVFFVSPDFWALAFDSGGVTTGPITVPFLMALGVGVMLIVGALNGAHEMIELTPATLKNWHSDPQNNILVPMLFIVVSCGAISGFHSTQSPLMSRCLKNEKYARPVFYGAMIAEGIVAMIWATAAMAYFGGPEGLNNAMTEGIMVDGVLTKITPAIAVDMICKSWLGKVGAVVAVIGVVVCPITSGDTAFRSLRLTIADFLKTDQKPILKRFLICIPIFALAFFCCKMDFSTVWKYVGIFNQVLATLVLWTSAAYLADRKKPHWMCSVPAAFLTFVCVSYFVMAPHSTGGLHLAPAVGYIAGIAAALVLLILFVVKARRR